MKPEIIIPIIAAAVLILLFLLCVPRTCRLREITGTRFICPRCGYRFRVKWYRLLFSRRLPKRGEPASLTCPLCRTHDLCQREEES